LVFGPEMIAAGVVGVVGEKGVMVEGFIRV
jgi:hypothetical protein